MNEHIEQRFFNKVDKTNSCWNWTALRSKQGYGRLTVNRKNYTAHRISWILHNGEIPDGLFVCHHCDNTSCVNPDHLFLGTAKDNALDRSAKGRGRDDNGKKHPSAKLKECDVYYIREKLSEGVLGKDLAAKFNVCCMTISNIKTGRRWRSVK